MTDSTRNSWEREQALLDALEEDVKSRAEELLAQGVAWADTLECFQEILKIRKRSEVLAARKCFMQRLDPYRDKLKTQDWYISHDGQITITCEDVTLCYDGPANYIIVRFGEHDSVGLDPSISSDLDPYLRPGWKEQAEACYHQAYSHRWFMR